MKIGIIGIGLIGGSLAKALKARTEDSFIIAYDKNETSLNQALSEKNIDVIAEDVNADFSECDIIFICTPVDITVNYIVELEKIVHPSCIITDVGSTKKIIHQQVTYPNFIGGHPMTGSEKNNYESSYAHLFENAFYILTPTENTSENSLNILIDLIKTIGALPIVLPYEKHDDYVAFISHVPHILACALVNFVNHNDTEEKTLHTLCAGGFKDITRIASGDANLWTSIISNNKEPITNTLNLFIEELYNMKNTLSQGSNLQLEEYLLEAKNYRDSFSQKNVSSGVEINEIFLDVKDEPGIIAKVATLLSYNDLNIKNIGIVNNREFQDGALQILFESKSQLDDGIQVLKNNNFKIYR